VSFAAITLCVASQRVFIVVVYFVIDSVWKLLASQTMTSLCIVFINLREFLSHCSDICRITTAF
jgi:hypothetical protein